VFEDVKEACAAAQAAFEQLKHQGHRRPPPRSSTSSRTLCTKNAAEWGKFEFDETKIGRLEHKIEKLQIVKLVPGVEWISRAA
jgi:aldehyde dehydrogenase